MGEEFEKELAEDWDEAADQLDTELCGEISVGVSDGMEFGEDA